jgi:hypothetical protein
MNIRKFILDNKNFFDLGLKLSKTLKNFEENRSVFSLIEGGFEIIVEKYTNFWTSNNFFAANPQYKILFLDNIQFLFDFFNKEMKSLETSSLKFTSGEVLHFVNLPCGEILLLESWNKKYFIYHDPSILNKETILDFLVNETLKKLNSNFIFCENKKLKNKEDNRNIFLSSREIKPFVSKTSEKYSSFIKKCLDKNINRSIIFYGQPGTGKTNLAQAIVYSLNLKTLIFNFNDFDLDNISFILDNLSKFKISDVRKYFFIDLILFIIVLFVKVDNPEVVRVFIIVEPVTLTFVTLKVLDDHVKLEL